MPNASAESLSQLVTASRERLAELALAGDQAVLIAAAQAAADAIEHRVGPEWAKHTSRQREPDAPQPIGGAAGTGAGAVGTGAGAVGTGAGAVGTGAGAVGTGAGAVGTGAGAVGTGAGAVGTGAGAVGPGAIGAAAAGPSPEHQALLAAQRFTFNVAADCWPGWAIPKEPPDPRNLLAALDLARHSVALVKKLELGPLRVGTGTWLCGAFELALGRRTDAESTFTNSLQHYRDGAAPGLALLTEGYLAIARAENVENVCVRIAAGGFQEGGEWIEQLRVAAQVFAT